MSRPTATVVPLRPARSQRVDLALALAMLNKGVTAHERAERARQALLARSPFRFLSVYAHAKSLGA
jgi:hypothetical protein